MKDVQPDFSPAAIRARVEQALLDEQTLAVARRKWTEVAIDVLSRNRDRTPGYLRASDAGRCSRELYADVHGLLDLSESPEALLKMSHGGLIGAWLACLLGAAFEAEGYGAHAEVAMDRDGISGHADLFVTRSVTDALGTHAEPTLVVEFKFSAWSGKHDGPKPYHLVQAAQYARMLGAPQFIVVQYYPATQARFDKVIGAKVSEPHLEPSQVYETKDFLAETDAEYARLRKGLGDATPDPDPSEAWRCRSCRFSGCDRNENALNPNRAKPQSNHAIL